MFCKVPVIRRALRYVRPPSPKRATHSFRAAGKAMVMVKAMVLGAIVTGCVALVLGSQGATGGRLAVEAVGVGDFKMFWSWPLFASGSGLFWGLTLLQR